MTDPTEIGRTSPVVPGRVVMLVIRYDEAFAFYRAALGAEPIFGRTTGAGQRLLHASGEMRGAAREAGGARFAHVRNPYGYERDFVPPPS